MRQGISIENEVVFIVIDLLGPSLMDLFTLCGSKFSLKTTLMITYQLLDRMQHMHLKNFIHRDLKPDNIMMGLGEDSQNLFLVDFGLTRSIIDSKTGKHIKFKGGKNLVGTCRYVSVNSHLGHELSRRDDLISVGYIMIEMLTGSLPWIGMHSGKPSARYRKIGDFKASISNKRLCKNCPQAFLDYMDHVTSMQFE